jgi:hypothetical protein
MAMRALAAPELLGTWERGLGQSTPYRALELLSMVHPEASQDELLAISIGGRDGDLLALRQQLFGQEMTGMVVCPRCTGRLDVTMNAAEMLSARGPESQAAGILNMDGYEVHFRCPNSEDLALELERDNPGGARDRLVARCLLSVQRAEAPVAFESLPTEIVDAVSARMAEADPLADVQLSLACPSCDHRWRAAFDIVSFLWREIESLAARLLREVHTLASAYGWHERDILALSAVRRQYYLTLLGV